MNFINLISTHSKLTHHHLFTSSSSILSTSHSNKRTLHSILLHHRFNSNQSNQSIQSNSNQSSQVDISLFSPLLDPHPSESGPYHQIFFGSKPPFDPLPDEIVNQSIQKAGNDLIIESLPPNSLTDREIKQLHKYPLVVKRVVNQTGKGKIPSMYTLVVVGNGNGLVGYGEGKSETIGAASSKALRNAVRNLSPVQLFEARTIHTELRSKFHATEIVMRPRPAGFGLRVNPYLHQVAKAAGISDLSAKVTRSNNPMNVIKLSLMMLQSGSAPIGMGDGFGGKGRRLEKGIGMRTGHELALMRGRRCQPVFAEDL
ncbi:ribosomal protein S5, N-terminal domain-containing protein, partial [Melampsora americana]